MNKTPRELALLAARALSEKKGREIQVLEIADLTTLADYFVLCTGSSNTQINALVDNVEKVLTEQAGEEPLHREGYRGGTWVLRRSPGVLRPGAPVAGRQERGPGRRCHRWRLISGP